MPIQVSTDFTALKRKAFRIYFIFSEPNPELQNPNQDKMPFQGGNKNFRPGSSDRGGPPPNSGSGSGASGGGSGGMMGGPRPGVPGGGGANFQPSMGNGAHANKWASHGARGVQSGPPGKAR